MTIVKLQTAARVTGAKIVCESSGRFSTYQVEAPAGMVWIDGFVHALRVEWRIGEPGYRKEAITDALDRMAVGLTACPYGDQCDYCHPEPVA